LYAATATSAATTVYVGSLDQEMKVPVVQSDTGAIFADGYLLFIREDTLLAQPLDPARRTTTGESVVVAQNVLNVRNTASANFSASATGTLSYLAGMSETSTQLVWVDRSGKLSEKVGEPSDQTELELLEAMKTAGCKLNTVRPHPRSGCRTNWGSGADAVAATNSRRSRRSICDGWQVTSRPSASTVAASEQTRHGFQRRVLLAI
ncbi:MAG: hypothetical protein ABIS29_00030, partial [Vicinamibacterales bacterium]